MAAGEEKSHGLPAGSLRMFFEGLLRKNTPSYYLPPPTIPTSIPHPTRLSYDGEIDDIFPPLFL